MVQQTSKQRRGGCITFVLVAGLFAGCSSGSVDSNADTPVSSAPESGDNAPSSQAFIGAFEDEGLECAPHNKDDYWGPGVVEQYNCSGDSSVKMTIRNFEDAAARDRQLEKVQDLVCETSLSRVTSVDTWIVMPGGSRDVDFEIFGNAMESLGLGWNDYTCQDAG